MPSPRAQTYAARAQTHPTTIGKQLLFLMAGKESNLCLSVDVVSPTKVLKLVEEIGRKICLLKTHIDIMTFGPSHSSCTLDECSIEYFTNELTRLADKHSFLIFEDRKFADIGSTVQHQYAGGVYRIADWAHITNAHTVPGPGIISGLKQVVSDKHLLQKRGLLLLGEMSSAGNLGGGEYLAKTLEMAREQKDFVMGFIAMGGVHNGEGEDWIVMTPGVDLGREGDGLGQQYRTPEKVVMGGSDVIIVGRGIVNAKDPLAEAERYRVAGWEAFKKRVKEQKWVEEEEWPNEGVRVEQEKPFVGGFWG